MNCQNQDDRLRRLHNWLHSIYGDKIESVTPASEDASFRRYFRFVVGESSFIAMDAPVDQEKTAPFVRIAKRFRNCGLNTPQIHQWDEDQGFVVLSDFGSKTYLHSLSADTADDLYADAIDALVTLQQASLDDPNFLPTYDEHLLRSEMELFRTWYLGTHRKGERRPCDDAVLDQSFDLLVQDALNQPRVWVHLDYHSRNLMHTEIHNPGLIDFQDARYGPITYDIVSLLRDCYIKWSPHEVEAWIKLYLRKARQHNLPVGDDDAKFFQQFDWMGIQRHLKAAGIFARLNHRDNKSDYLQDIPRVLSYIASASTSYEQLRPLSELINRLLKTLD